VEFLSEEQLRLFFQLSKENKNAIRNENVNVEGYQKCKNISILKPHNYLENQRIKLINVELPEIFGLKNSVNKEKLQLENDIYLYRNLLEFDVYDTKSRERVKETKALYDAFLKNR
jgi:hypothetical protein